MKTSLDAKVAAAVVGVVVSAAAGFATKSSAGLLLFAVDRHTNHMLLVYYFYEFFDCNFHSLAQSHLFLPQPQTNHRNTKKRLSSEFKIFGAVFLDPFL